MFHPMSPGTLQKELRQKQPFRSAAEEAALGLYRTSARVQRRISETIESSGITLQQYNVLRILRGARPARIPTLEVAARMIEQTPGVTRLLDRLEARGLIVRERCTVDRRRVFCTISDSGLALVEALDGPVLATIDAVLGHLPADRLQQLTTLLDAVREGLSTNRDATQGAQK